MLTSVTYLKIIEVGTLDVPLLGGQISDCGLC